MALSAQLSGDGASVLIDGVDRDRTDESHAWVGIVGQGIEYRWSQPVRVGAARLVFDSNLSNDKRMPCSYPQNGNRCALPGSLVKEFRIEALDEGGRWHTVHSECENSQRLVRVPLDVETSALRLVPEATWGDVAVRIFGFEPQETYEAKLPTVESGPHFSDVRDAIEPSLLAPPENGLEDGKSFFHAA